MGKQTLVIDTPKEYSKESVNLLQLFCRNGQSRRVLVEGWSDRGCFNSKPKRNAVVNRHTGGDGKFCVIGGDVGPGPCAACDGPLGADDVRSIRDSTNSPDITSSGELANFGVKTLRSSSIINDVAKIGGEPGIGKLRAKSVCWVVYWNTYDFYNSYYKKLKS